MRHYIVNNFGWKALSLLAATLIWLTIHSSIQGTIKSAASAGVPGSTVTLNLPIIVATAAVETHAFRISPRTVDVTLGGDPDLIAKLKASDVDAFVNLIDVVGARDLRKKVQVRAPQGINVSRIEPGDVTVETLPAPESPVRSKPNPP